MVAPLAEIPKETQIESKRASEMAQRIKVLVVMPDDLSSILGTHNVEKETTDSSKLCFDLHHTQRK